MSLTSVTCTDAVWRSMSRAVTGGVCAGTTEAGVGAKEEPITELLVAIRLVLWLFLDSRTEGPEMERDENDEDKEG